MEAYELGTVLGQGMMMGVIIAVVVLALFLTFAMITAIMSVFIHSELKKINIKLGKMMYAKQVNNSDIQHRNAIEDIDRR